MAVKMPKYILKYKLSKLLHNLPFSKKQYLYIQAKINVTEKTHWNTSFDLYIFQIVLKNKQTGN